jgi:hypothetical protein
MSDVLRRLAARVPTGTIRFTDLFIHQGVPVPALLLPWQGRGQIAFVAELPADSVFVPELHPYEEQMLILEGSGKFFCGITRSYGPGDELIVAPGALHEFVQVAARTVLLKYIPDIYARAR